MQQSSALPLLRRAFAYIPEHGFTRQAIALANTTAVHSAPRSSSASTPNIGNNGSGTPLSDTAISALFGAGDRAQRTLIRAWLEEGRGHMGAIPVNHGIHGNETEKNGVSSMEDVLLRRLEWNEPVLPHLKDAYALLATSGSAVVPIIDVRPALEHAFAVADEACYLVAPSPGADSVSLMTSLPSTRFSELIDFIRCMFGNHPTRTGILCLPYQANWWTRRMGVAGIYAAAELHQLSSPETTSDFLRRLLQASEGASQMLHEVGLFAEFGARGWAGILKGRGVFP